MPGEDRPSAPLRRFLGAYYAYVFLFDFMLVYAVYTALFRLRGLSITEIAILLAFWSASAIVLELPSGALSDHFDRRLLLIAAPLIKVLTFVCWGFADGNFWLYGLGFLFWSLAQSWFSGTAEALLYERMESEGRAADYDKVLGREHAAGELGIGVGILIGGFVAAVSMDMTIWLSIPPLLLGSAVALLLKDVRRTKEPDPEAETPSYFSHFRTALSEFRTHRTIRFLTVYIAGGLIVLEVLEEFDQLYYLAVGLPIWAFGIVGFIVVGINAGANVLAHRLSPYPMVGWLLPLIAGLLLIVSAQAASIWLLIPLMLAYVVIAPADVLAEAKFQRTMGGASRATTTSALVVFVNITGIAVTLGFGLLTDAFGVLPAYGWAGAYLALFGLWAWWRSRAGLSATA